MSESALRTAPIGKCIYCGATERLSDEHVIPYGLSGDLVLKKSSCEECAKITSLLERKLLRGHWWPYRQFLGLKSRRAQESLPNIVVKIHKNDADSVDAELPMSEHKFAIVFDLDAPTILRGVVSEAYPNAPRVAMKVLAANPMRKAIIHGELRELAPGEKTEVPVNLDAGDVMRFLAKVAHAYAISRRGINACKKYYLPPYIIGKADGLMTYVGGNSSSFIGPYLPGPRGRLHVLLDRVNGHFLTVYIQLFRDKGDPPPIYEVVVGRLADHDN